ncbi:MAG: hypothetical protein GC134_04990 [Proteobacteria bacterium]|nr:hypothetical protein [Pseudomonadota bacterium]
MDGHEPSSRVEALAGASKGSNAAISLIANVLVGGLMGYGIDYLAGTLPLFMLLMLFMGFAAGLRTIWKQLNSKPPQDSAE